jgi:hypothetical protein
VFTNRCASLPKRALNLTQTVVRELRHLDHRVPSASRVPAGRFSSRCRNRRRTGRPRAPSVPGRPPRRGRRRVRSPASLCEPVRRSVARALAAARGPVVADETILEIELGLFDKFALVTTGRRTINSTVPSTAGERRISSSPASSSSVVRCLATVRGHVACFYHAAPGGALAGRERGVSGRRQPLLKPNRERRSQ